MADQIKRAFGLMPPGLITLPRGEAREWGYVPKQVGLPEIT